MSDTLKIWLWIGLAALALGAACILFVTNANSASRNLALSVSTLIAAIILFSINARFELRESVSVDAFSGEFTTDRQKPEIRQWRYENLQGRRVAAETSASRWLAENNAARFEGDRKILTRDFAIFSLIRYLTLSQFDWRVIPRTFQGSTAGTLETSQQILPDEKCTFVLPEEVEGSLAAAGNAFAGSGIFITNGRLCLPPKASLQITDSSLIIATPFCTITFDVDLAGFESFVQPGTGGDTPQLPNGRGNRYETRLFDVQTRVTYSWMRAQSRDMPKYEEWSTRVVNGAKRWFEGDPD